MTTARIPFALSLLLLAAGFGGCVTAQPILRLTPRAPAQDLVWIGGVPVVSKSGQHSRVAVAFARDQEGKHAFRVEVQNCGEKTLLLDSRNFSFRTCYQVAGAPEKCGTRFQVTDPEEAILAMELQRSRDLASNKNEATFFSVMSVIDAVGGVASLASGNRRLTNNFSENLRGDLAMVNAIETNERLQVSAFEMERSNWALRAFRKTTTPPGVPVAGLVFVEPDRSASAVMLYATVDDEFYTFPFDQTVIYPDGAPTRREPPPDRPMRYQR